VLAIQTVMPVGYTILLLSAKQGGEINAMNQLLNSQFPITSTFKFVRSRRDPKEKITGTDPDIID
jgi:hypothetical protein